MEPVRPGALGCHLNLGCKGKQRADEAKPSGSRNTRSPSPWSGLKDGCAHGAHTEADKHRLTGLGAAGL